MTAPTRLSMAIALAACILAGQTVYAQQRTSGDERVQALLGLARVKRDAGDRTAARGYFEEARRLRPFAPAELAEYFWLLAGQDAKAALAVGRDVLAGAPTNQDVRDRMITEAIATGEETTVVALATDGQRLDPGTARWPRRIAESALRQSHPDDAAAAFARAANAPDATPEDRVGLAVSLEATKRYAESAAAWEHVPAPVRSEREEWEQSRLRALAHGAALSVAAPELEAWLSAHPGDEAVRDLLVDLWVRAGQPDRALAALPAPEQSSDRWIRRRAAIARAAGMPAVSAALMEGLVARGTATADDRWTLAELLVEGHAYPRAATVLQKMASDAPGCDDRLLTLIDRVPDALGTNLLIGTLDAPKCKASPQWLRRGIERSEALARHQDALTLIARLPPAEQQQIPTRRLAGQLRLWTGDVRGAIGLLESVLQSAAGDGVAREALIDAYRADGRPYEAWRVAEPLVTTASLSRDRVVSLAELALEADRPAQVAPLLEHLAPTPDNGAVRAVLLGRSLLADGRPAAARGVLAAVSPRDLTPAGALALVDSVRAMSGAEAALAEARRFPADTKDWRDVLIRRATLEAIAGDAEHLASVRQTLQRFDADAPIFADAETALAKQRPADALAALAQIPNDPQPERAADLEAVALANTDHVADALAIVTRLRRTHPASMPLRLREAELTFRLSPTDESLARLIELSSRPGGYEPAAIAVARSLDSLRRYDQALAALGPDAAWRTLPQDGRFVAAETLRALGRPQEALALLADEPASNATASALRVSVTVQLAAARWADRDAEGAKIAASQALDLDPHAAEAWFILLDATAAHGTASDVEAVLHRFENTAAAQRALAIGMAERLGGLMRSASDPMGARALALLDSVAENRPRGRFSDNATALAADLARARILASMERWTDSIAAADAALVRDPASTAALKLRAEVLSWAGHYSEALAAYDVYLSAQPGDIEARRQQARVAGWAGWFGQSKRLYGALQMAFPNDASIAAEVAAKTAFFDGRWRAAADAYDRWIALDPNNGEARFERAEALRAEGQIREADAALTTLESTTGHRLAASALDRATFTRRPSASVIADQRSTNGYEGRRLLDLGQQGGAFAATFGASGRTTINADAVHVSARAGDAVRQGARFGVATTTTASAAVQVDARAMFWSFSDGGLPDLLVRAAWRPADRWVLGAGANREPIFENIMTIDRRIGATGVFADAAFESPRTSVNAQVSRQALTDGNARTRATISISQSVSERLKQVRLVGWAESLAYRESAADYYSPARHLRLDAGLEYAHAFSTPKFRGDREQVLAFGYLVGTDEDGVVYHHPSLRLTLEFARGLAIDARANWIRSDVYNETSAYVGLRVLTGKGQR